ncbi:MAG: radical SAM protein, partial [Nanoarchaeota archaeon]|nr:radical SAM protein [Nanoarchaeota archaeon]
MKIILIDPPGFGEGISTGLAYLVAIAKKNGFDDIKVVDFQNYRQDINERMEKIIEESPDIIGITVNSFTIINALDIIKQLRDKLQKTKFIAGGPGVTSDPKIFLQRTKGLFDIGVFGEGEITFVELLDYFKENKPANLSQFAGLVYWIDENIIVNQKRALNFDLDGLALPNYDVFDSVETNLLEKNYQILTSRGCPAHCVFCMNIVLNQAIWRGRSPENVIDELVLAKKKYNIESFTIRDDNFTQDMDRAEKICERLIELNFNIPWKCKAAIRADRVRPSLLRKMKQSHCKGLTLGIESGDRNIFPLIQKGESLDKIVTGINMIKEA